MPRPTRSPRTDRRLLVVLLLALVPALLAAAPVQAQPGFAKSFQPATIAPDSTSTLVFTVDNSGMPTPAANLAFSDPLPAGVVIETPASATTTCGGTVTAPDGGGTITFTGGSVGADSVCEVRVDVTSSTVAVHMNVSGDLTSTAGNSGNATADLTVAADRPTFTKSFSPAAVQLGGRSTLTFTIDNPAGAGGDVFRLEFDDTLPTGLEVADPSNLGTDCPFGTLTAAPGGSTVAYTSNTPFLSAGASCTVTVDVVATGGGAQVNRSGELLSESLSRSFGSSGFAVATLPVDVDTLALTKSFVDDPAPPGGTVTLRFSLTNFDRLSGATNLTFTDDLDATLGGLVATGLPASDVCGPGSLLTGTSLLTLTGGNLGPGETCTFDVVLQVPAGAASGAYPNTTSTVTGDVGGTPTVGAPATETLFVAPVPRLTKSFPDGAVVAGDTALLRFELTNTSSTDSATGLGFSDDLTAFLPGFTSADVLSVPAAGFCGGSSSIFVSIGTLFVSNASLAPGASCTFDVTIQVSAGTTNGAYVNITSEVTGTVDGLEVTGSPASATLPVVAPPTLTKSFLPAFVQAGDTAILEFTLFLNENAPGPATGIAFTDDLGAALTGLQAVSLPADGFCGPGSTASGTSVLSVSGASLAPGTECTFAVTVEVPAGAAPGTYTNTTSTVDATVDGLALTGAAASGDLTVVALELTKSFVDGPAVAGGTVDLAFTIQNFSTGTDTTSLTFTDDLGSVLTGLSPLGLPQNDVCGAGSQLFVSGSTLTLAGGSVPAGTSCSFTVTLQVPADAAAGFYGNTTSFLQGDFGGTAISAPPAQDELEVIAPLSITKSFVDDPVAPGDPVTLEFTLANASPTDSATGLTFTDDLDAALSGLAATTVPAAGFCGPGSAATGGGVLTVTGASLTPGGSCTFQVTVTVPAAVPAGTEVINTTSDLSGLVGGVAATAPPATDVLRIDQLALTKAFASPVGVGQTVVLSFEIVNRGAAQVSGVSFTDDLGAVLPGLVATGLPAADVCGAGSSLSGTSLLTFSGGVLDAGASCTFDVTVQVPAGAVPGSYLNTTSAVSVQGLVAGTPATDTLQVEPAPLFGKVFAPEVLGVGEPSTLTFTIDNTAASVAAQDLAFLDVFPAGLVVADPANASTTCAGGTITAAPGAGSVSYSGGTVAAGASCTVQVDVTSPTANSYANVSGALTSTLGDSGTASAPVGFLAGALTFAKRFLGTAVAGGVVDLEFTLTNAGGAPVTGISFTDDLETVMPGVVALGLPLADVCSPGSEISGTSVLTFTGGNLAAGTSCTFVVPVQLPDPLGAPPYENVTSPVTYTEGNAALEAPAATAVLAQNVLAIPTLSFWGMLLMALLVGVLGWWRLR